MKKKKNKEFLLVQIYEIENNNKIIGTNRVSSHPEEKYIGRVRYLCNDDNRFTAVSYNIARYEFIIRHVAKCPIEFKSRHNNPGGCRIDIGKADFANKISPEIISKEILSLVGLSQSSSPEKLTYFLNDLRSLLMIFQ